MKLAGIILILLLIAGGLVYNKSSTSNTIIDQCEPTGKVLIRGNHSYWEYDCKGVIIHG